MRRILNILLAISSVTLSQCVSGPKSGISLGADSRVAVVYEQTKQNLRQSIHCDRQIDPAVYYSSATADKLAKIATVEQMQILLDGLAECGFFREATPQPDSDAVSALSIEIDGVPKTWSLSLRTEPDTIAGYHQALAWFQNVYNQIGSFHTGTGGTTLQAEHERLQRNYEERTGVRKERP